jgi:uridine kinase
MARLIGIAGGTGAGKTTVTRLLEEQFGGIAVVDLDSYYLDRSGVSPEGRARINYDEPAAIDAALLLAHVRDLAAGRPVPKPLYSFESHCRVGSVSLSPAPVIVVDGLFTLWWQELRAMLDLKVFVDAAADVRLARRILRDVAERGRTVDSVLAQYLATIRPMHERYVEPTRRYADVVVATAEPGEAWADAVIMAVGAMVHGSGS